MTIDEVRELVSKQSSGHLTDVNHHRITLMQALVPPQEILIIARDVKNGRISDQELAAWLVGQENSYGGYKIILREDGLIFGLASSGFPNDRYPILVGWYGDLLSTFLGM